MNQNVKIRVADPGDARKLLSIYEPYVRNTAISFEYQVPDPEEFQERIIKTLKRYPYLVAEADEIIAGYAYTGPFVGRAAYDRAAEISIYIEKSLRKTGIGRRLYQAIEEISRAQNIVNLYACISWTEQEDEYLTNNSAQFHAHMGYRMAGTFHKCGYKFGRWYDMIWMEKIIGSHTDNPEPVIWFPDLQEKRLTEWDNPI